jgi:zinc protease
MSAEDSTGRRVAVDSLTISYETSGVRVIQRPAYGNHIVSVNLYLIGGTQQLTPATAGIEPLALEAAAGGTRRYPGGRSNIALRRTGSQVGISAGADWTVFEFEGLADQFDSTWAVFADRIVAPTLDSAVVARTRARLRTEARRRHQQPDAWIREVADSMTFAGHPYGIDPDGTETSMEQLTAADVRRYVAEQFVTSRMLLVIVGTLPRERVEHAVAATLGALPRGTYTWTLPPPVPERKSSITIIDHTLNTNYLLGYFVGPPINSPDYTAFHAATNWLGGELSYAIREKRSLSYAAGAPYYGRAIAFGGVYASSILPSDVATVMREQLERAKTVSYRLWQVREDMDGYDMSYYLSHETNADQAEALARAQILLGDYRKADAEFEAFQHVSGEAMREAAQRYMKHMQFVYLGDAKQFKKSLVDGL